MSRGVPVTVDLDIVWPLVTFLPPPNLLIVFVVVSVVCDDLLLLLPPPPVRLFVSDTCFYMVHSVVEWIHRPGEARADHSFVWQWMMAHQGFLLEPLTFLLVFAAAVAVFVIDVVVIVLLHCSRQLK